jgi:hypothetical protein
VAFRRVNHVRHIFDRLLEAGISGYGVLPNLISERGQINLGILLAIQQASFLVVEIVRV